MSSGPPNPSRRGMEARGRFTLWPPRYGVAALATFPPLPDPDAGSPPVMVVQEAGEITLVAPEEVLSALGSKVLRRSQGWRALTLDGVFPPEAVGVLAALTRALAEARVPVMAFSSFRADHLLVPEGHLGRALAALAQVTLAT